MATASSDGGGEKGIRVNFRKELLQYQSVRIQQESDKTMKSGREWREQQHSNKTHNIWRNFVSQCSASFLAVLAVIPSRNLQSSMHGAGDLGKMSLCCMYGSYVLGCFLTGVILQRLKAKTLLLASLFFHILYSVANVIPSFYTLLPASCLVGLCQPAFWRLQDSLLLGYGLRYSAMASLPPQKALRLFQTVTIITVHSAQILGNLLGSLLISASHFPCSDDDHGGVYAPFHHHLYHQHHLHQNSNNFHHPRLIHDDFNTNDSSITADMPVAAPLPHLHPNQDSMRLAPHDKRTYAMPFVSIHTRLSPDDVPQVSFYQLLTLIYLSLSVVAMGTVLIFFQTPDVTVQPKLPAWRHKVRDVARCARDPRWLLVWSAAVYIGFAQGVIISNITKEFGSEVFGCFIVGYMMVSFGTGNLLAILLLDKMRAYSTHPFFLASGFLMNVGVLILTLLWRPSSDQSTFLMLYTAVWGVVDGTLQSQVQAVVGRYAREDRDTAMTLFRVMQGLGLVSSFLLSVLADQLTTSLYLAFPILVLGFLGLVLATNQVTNRQRRDGFKDNNSPAQCPFSPQGPPQAWSSDGRRDCDPHINYSWGCEA